MSDAVTAAIPLAVARAALRTLEQRHAGFEHRDGRVRKARVDETRLFALKTSFRSLGRVVDEALCQEQRLGGLAERRPHRAAMDEAGRRAEGRGMLGHGMLGGCRPIVIRDQLDEARGLE